MIACPACGLPLLLAAERRGRWVVGYDHLRLRVGRAAMLVCPNLDCSHQEDVKIAGNPDDAVVYSSRDAASRWRMSACRSFETLGELHAQLVRIADVYRRTGNPKAPSAYRFWRTQYRRAYWMVVPGLKRGLKSNEEVVLQGKQTNERGRILELLKDSVVLDRSENHETVLVPLADISHVSQYIPELCDWPTLRFDFHQGLPPYTRTHCVHTPTRFAIISGHRVVLHGVTRHGKCHISTDDHAVAQALGVRLRVRGHYHALVPAGFVDRCFESVRWCYVRGHRMELHSATADPDLLQLRTRSMETARELKMRREWSQFVIVGARERNQLRWWGYFHKVDIERTEEKQIPLDMSELIRAEQVRYRKAQADQARWEREWALEEAEWDEDDEDAVVDEDEDEDEDDDDDDKGRDDG